MTDFSFPALLALLFTPLLALHSAPAAAQLDPMTGPKAAAPEISTKIYEKEETQEIKAKVKSLREIRGETEVRFESEKFRAGYILPEGPSSAALKESLQLSAKPGGPAVTVTIDEMDRIKSVRINHPASGSPAKSKIFEGE